ncbi:MAG TPA: STAS domain-containing protein [Pseudonocardiaceae bacterium]|nr:STAS domain-containing protein [Pseudonocardiaceae bacterium]
MEIVVQHPDSNSGPVVVVTGDVDLATAPKLRQVILDLLAEEPPQRIRVDLTAVSLLDSTGIFVLVDCYKRARERGVSLTVEHPQQIVRRVLEICGLLEILTEG